MEILKKYKKILNEKKRRIYNISYYGFTPEELFKVNNNDIH